MLIDADYLLVPPHSHHEHLEVFWIAEGQLHCDIGPISRVFGPEDGEIEIHPGTRHTFHSIAGQRAVLYERSEPRVRRLMVVIVSLTCRQDGNKEIAFRNLTDGGYERNSTLVRAMTAFYKVRYLRCISVEVLILPKGRCA
jgi:hypothetical protein